MMVKLFFQKDIITIISWINEKVGEQLFFSFSNYVKNIALNLRVGNGEKQVGFVCVISENTWKKILCNRLFLSCQISTFMFNNKSWRLKNENKLYQLVASIDLLQWLRHCQCSNSGSQNAANVWMPPTFECSKVGT